MQEGPSLTHIPAREYWTCAGCTFLRTELVRCGSFANESNYYCENPTLPYMSDKLIDGMRSKIPNTPYWCPILKKIKNEK